MLQDDAEPLETSFELNDTLFAKANIEKVNEVYLWLGVSSQRLPLPRDIDLPYFSFCPKPALPFLERLAHFICIALHVNPAR